MQHDSTLNTDPLLDPIPAANYIHSSRTTLDRLTRAGELRPVRIGRKVCYRVSELERFLDAASAPQAGG